MRTTLTCVAALTIALGLLFAACNRGDTSTNTAKTAYDTSSAPLSLWVPDSMLRPSIVDTTSVTLPAGSDTQIWRLARTVAAWYVAGWNDWSLVDQVRLHLVDGSDSTFAAAKSFIEGRGDVVTSRWVGGSRNQFQSVDVNVNPTNPHGYVTADVPLPVILTEYAKERAFVDAIGLPIRTPITTLH